MFWSCCNIIRSTFGILGPRGIWFFVLFLVFCFLARLPGIGFPTLHSPLAMAPSSHIHAPVSSQINSANGGASHSQNYAHAHSSSREKSAEGAYLLSSLPAGTTSVAAPSSSASFQVASHNNNVVNKNAAPHAGSKKKVNWGSSAAVDSPTNHNLNLNLATHASAPASPMPSSSSSLNRDILATLNSHGVPHFARRVVPGVHDEPEKSVVATENLVATEK